MQPAEIYPPLTRLFHEVFGRSDIEVTPALTAHDVAGWNSFKNVELILGVEECFGIELGSRDIDHLDTVGDLVATIARKLAAGA